MSARPSDPHRLGQYLKQVVDIGEVLHYRVQDYQVDAFGRQRSQLMRRRLSKRDMRQVVAPGQLGPQLLQHRGGEVQSKIARAAWGQRPQQQSGTTANLQYPARTQGTQ